MKRDLAALVDEARDDALPLAQQHRAFAELVRRFEEQAFHWALQRLDDPEEARDAAQDAFLAAWQKLRHLREPAAFGTWLKRLIATQCTRRRRAKRTLDPTTEQRVRSAEDRHDQQRMLTKAIAKLSDLDRRIIILFYFLGRTMRDIGAILELPKGTVGKHLHSARLTIRKHLPRAVRAQFFKRINEAIFDDYLGEYQFDKQPERIVRITREGSELVGYGGGQRNVLASLRGDAIVATEFDGEGRFERDRSGRVVRFVYYEFGARLGVARKMV